MKLWVQKWEESEAGWGTRPDGYTLHVQRDDIQRFLADMRARERQGKPDNYIPPEYSRPDGEPYEWETEDEVLIAQVGSSANGCWGPGRDPPAPARGRRAGDQGRVTVAHRITDGDAVADSTGKRLERGAKIRVLRTAPHLGGHAGYFQCMGGPRRDVALCTARPIRGVVDIPHLGAYFTARLADIVIVNDTVED